MLEITRVQTEADYDAALTRISELLGGEPYSPEDEELDRISTLVERYEEEHYPMDDPDPHSMLEFMLDQEMTTREQLIPLAGDEASLDAMLAGKRAITPELAALMHERTGLSMEDLIRVEARPSVAASD